MKPKVGLNGEKKDLAGNSDLSVSSLHGDIQEVINTMGPHTPHLPAVVDVDSGDEATISSNNFSHNSNTSNGTSNTSFVEVIIKNHHRKSKIIHENSQHVLRKPSLSHVLVQTENEKYITLQEPHLNPPNITDKETKNETDNIANTKIQDINSSFQTTVLPQRYFKINPTPNKKQETIINIIPNNDIYCKSTGFKDSTQNSYDLKRNEKRLFIANNDNILKPFNQEDYQGKTELYYFDRGNFSFYNTTDYPPIIMADHLAEKTENTAIRFWTETFGMANVALAFVTTFILQLVRFALFGIVRPMTAGLIQLTSDYFIKPLLASVFNGFIQPPLIFIFNILVSVRDVCEPIAQTLGFFTREMAVVFRSFRLVEVKKNDAVSV